MTDSRIMLYIIDELKDKKIEIKKIKKIKKIKNFGKT